jgi:hypothetical protein
MVVERKSDAKNRTLKPNNPLTNENAPQILITADN